MGEYIMDIVTLAASRKYTDKKIMESAAVGIKYEVVDSLPSSGNEQTIYFVKNDSSSSNNHYDEYVWISSSSTFEKIGSSQIDGSTTLHINVTAVNMETMEATFTADKTPAEMQQASANGPTWCVVSFAAGIMAEEASSIGLPPAWIGGAAAFGCVTAIVHNDNGNNKIACAVKQEFADTWSLDLTAFGS